MMRYLFVSCLIFLIKSYSIAQITQTARYEVELANLNDSYFTASAEDEGLFIFKENLVKSTINQKVWDIIWLDTALKEVLKWEISLSAKLYFKASTYSDKEMILFFQSEITDKEDMIFLRYKINDKSIKIIPYNNLVPLDISHFEKKKDVVIFGGSLKGKTVVKLFNFSNQSGMVLPGFYVKESNLLQINVNPKSEYIKIMTLEKGFEREFKIVIRFFSLSGSLKKTQILKPKKNLNLMDGLITNCVHNFIAGTYTLNKPLDKLDGFFIAKSASIDEEILAYHKFADLENFFGYMGEKKELSIKKRIARKKKKNKNIKKTSRVVIREIIHYDNGYLLFMEAYNITYNTNWIFYNGYTTDRTPFYNSIYRFDPLLPIIHPQKISGYKYSHAIVIKTDINGRIIWDDIIDMGDTYYKRQLINKAKLANTKRGIVLLYLENKNLFTKTIANGKSIEDKHKIPLMLKSEHDRVEYSTYYFEGLKKWHDNTFYAYGVNSISNTKLSVDNERKVFFINKIVVE